MALRSLFPALVAGDWWSTWDYPERIMDQCFGMQLHEDDLLAPVLYHGFLIHPRTQTNIANSGISEVKNSDKEFQVSLNVQQFKPEEIEVKIVDNCVVIHGKHEDKKDENSFCSREFTRRYMLPKECQAETVTSSLTTDGMLKIVAPKKAIKEPPKQERKVEVTLDKSESDGK